MLKELNDKYALNNKGGCNHEKAKANCRYVDMLLITALMDVKHYRGENGYSYDLLSNTAQTIKKYLADMIFGTSVTIAIPSITKQINGQGRYFF